MRGQYRAPRNFIYPLAGGGRRKIVVAVGNEVKPRKGLLQQLSPTRAEMMGKLDQPRIIFTVDEIDRGFAIEDGSHQSFGLRGFRRRTGAREPLDGPNQKVQDECAWLALA